MVGFDLVGVGLVAAAIIYSFVKKRDKVGMALIIVLLILLYMLGYFS
ncbi:hypothetical protein HZA99_01395 [Candidatus Woesearchaeota archaeon]|nr:hypothetical protein [Candidatus Woesearchaeota archaeon]